MIKIGVFINIGMQPDVFMNKEEITETNQEYFKTDYVSEMINEQKRINDALLHSSHLLTSLYENQESSRASQWKEIDSQLRELKKSNLQRNQFEEKAMERLKLLGEKDLVIQDSLNQLNEYKSSAKELAQQIEDRLLGQEEYQNQVLSRLESQEALMEKVLRQINHFRNVIFERTNHLTEKIQDNYNLTSFYMYRLFTNSDQPQTLFMKSIKGEETKNTPK